MDCRAQFSLLLPKLRTELAPGEASLKSYIDYWKSEVASARLGQVARAEWAINFDTLVRIGMFWPADLDELLTKYSATGMRTLNVCPGLKFGYAWVRQTALDLDATGKLSEEIVAKVNQAFGTW